MVKGMTRQVVVVKAPDPKLFDEAIFLVRPGAADERGVSDEELMRQANAAAGRYVTGTVSRAGRLRLLPGLLWSLCGAAAASIVWVIGLLF